MNCICICTGWFNLRYRIFGIYVYKGWTIYGTYIKNIKLKIVICLVRMIEITYYVKLNLDDQWSLRSFNVDCIFIYMLAQIHYYKGDKSGRIYGC